MPDMQTEVKKIIDSWSTPEIKQEVTPVENKSFPERIYDFIKANPKCSLKQIRDAIMTGVKDDSALTNALKNLYDRELIGRVMVDNPEFKGFGRRKVFVYWAVSSVYKLAPRGRGRPKGKVTKLVARKKTAPPPAPRMQPEPKPAKNNPGVQYLLKNLTIYEAKALWQELNEVFGK
jgi:hypothetical protein